MLLVMCLLNTMNSLFAPQNESSFLAISQASGLRNKKAVHAQHCRHCYRAEQTEGGLLACWIQARVSKLLQQPCVSMRAQTLI